MPHHQTCVAGAVHGESTCQASAARPPQRCLYMLHSLISMHVFLVQQYTSEHDCVRLQLITCTEHQTKRLTTPLSGCADRCATTRFSVINVRMWLWIHVRKPRTSRLRGCNRRVKRMQNLLLAGTSIGILLQSFEDVACVSWSMTLHVMFLRMVV